MSSTSTIEWTDATWSTFRGCVKISPGCKNCYALTFSERFRGVPGHPFEKGFDPRVVGGALGIPESWKQPRRIFVNSMSDTFLKEFEPGHVWSVLDVAHVVSRHTYQFLTKRAGRMLELVNAWLEVRGLAEVPSHMWMGVSVEDQKFGLDRVKRLRDLPAAMRWLSIEPLLEDLGTLDLRGISWVVVGGESGNGARPFDLRWARDIVTQCHEQHVPVFVKQLGRYPVTGFYDDFREAYEQIHHANWPMPDGWIPMDGQPMAQDIVRLRTPVVDGKRDTKGKLMEFWPSELRVREWPVAT